MSSSAPPVPPRPYGLVNEVGPPPVPPLPASLRKELSVAGVGESPPHFERPLVAPRPHRVDPSIPANMASRLDDQIAAPFPIPSFNHLPMTAPATSDWSPWAGASSLHSSMASLSFSQHPPPTAPAPAPAPTAPPSLTAVLPTIPTLLAALSSIQSPAHDPFLKIAWARDVLFLADRAHHLHLVLSTPITQPGPSPTDPITAPLPLNAIEPDLARLVSVAVPLVLSLSSPFPAGQQHQPNVPMESWQAEAIYMRAVFSVTGAHPAHMPLNPRIAFRDFETAARGGYAGAWFRLGRDYETFGDLARAKDCFERGARLGVESCLYRMGMAHLLGQLNLPPSTATALPILHRAALLSSLETPQPAYVYSLLLLSEFTSIPPIPPALFSSLFALPNNNAPPTPLIPQGSSPHLEARHHLERAAYLHFSAAQYKLGHAYEFSEPPFAFDPLLSVQYYSLASQNGELEADMALSKWFLCGSSANGAHDPSLGHFDKDESLALTFASKASARSLPSAEFAMGYYAEVGIGQSVNIPAARHWYQLAQEHGNADAPGRLAALAASTPALLSRTEHEQRLTRTRTQAQHRAESQPLSPPWEGKTFPSMREQQLKALQGQLDPAKTITPAPKRDPNAVVEIVRKNSLAGYPPPALKVNTYAPPPSIKNSTTPDPNRVGSGRMPILHDASNRRKFALSDAPSPASPVGKRPGRRTDSPGRMGRLAVGVDQPDGHITPPKTAPLPSAGLKTPKTPPPPSAAPPLQTPRPTKHAATFAEMGFQGAKAEEKECIIM